MGTRRTAWFSAGMAAVLAVSSLGWLGPGGRLRGKRWRRRHLSSRLPERRWSIHYIIYSRERCSLNTRSGYPPQQDCR